ncbi:DUF952 domain-containing protein [Caulobacter zeae]|uniref:DUF952 domain-containing protein n=1 Tax=Caulobacter zeae TaxID=2055137 RepID=A0A2N5DP17_9CAUL|nr:DUF952 domain-containing protein [Caulobacter zeae]PLR27787.1 DUF952 domain-containing protein [Caulobacter zeae]
MTLVYKILPKTLWDEAKAAGQFTGAPIDHADGYIHLSAADQAQETAALYFKGQEDLLLVGFDADALGPELKWEASRGGALFPHLFRSLDPSEAISEKPLALDADGVPQLGLS